MSTILQNIIISLNGLSFLASLIFILKFFLSRTPAKLYLKLIFYIQTCDAIFALGLILFIIPLELSQNYCNFPAFVVNFGAMASALTRLAVTLLMYFAVKRGDLLQKTRDGVVFLTITVVSFILTAM